MKGQEDRKDDPGLKASGLPPATGPEQVPSQARVRTVGQPIVQEGHLVGGDLPVVGQPIVLANGSSEHDPANPARAPIIDAAVSRNAERAAAQKKLADLLAKGPGHPDYDPDEVHALHYAAAGKEVPDR